MFKPHHLVLLILITATASCKLVRSDDERQPVARVFDKYLYEDDIRDVTAGMSTEDSVVFVKNYIYNWGKEQLLIYRAEFNLREDQQDFDDLVTQYRHDLIKYAYLEKYVSENLDTAISPAEIKRYYDEHSQDFELKENILRCDFYVFSQNSPDLSKAKNWWRSPSEKNMERFLEYSSIFSVQKSVGDTNWISYALLAKEIPLPSYNQQQVLSQNERLILEDSLKAYFLEIHSYKIIDNVSPLPYVRATIKSIILNKRKLELIGKMEENLVDDAFNRKDFEIF